MSIKFLYQYSFDTLVFCDGSIINDCFSCWLKLGKIPID